MVFMRERIYKLHHPEGGVSVLGEHVYVQIISKKDCINNSR